jgi:hypothetical protein
MNSDAIQERLDRRPFEPLAIHVSNGEIHAIRHPDGAMVTRPRLVVVNRDTDRLVICSLIHIASIEMLQVA